MRTFKVKRNTNNTFQLEHPEHPSIWSKEVSFSDMKKYLGQRNVKTPKRENWGTSKVNETYIEFDMYGRLCV